MLAKLGRRENIPLIVAVLLALASAAAWFSPAEATLGPAVKLVYVHAALMWVGFGLITLSGLTGLVVMVNKNEGLAGWSYGALATGLLMFAATGLLGMLTAKITWGGVFWGEPRMVMLFEILALGAIALGVGRVSGFRQATGTANAAAAGAAWFLVLKTEKIIHPDSPIFRSDSTAIKVFPIVITVFLALAGLQVVRLWTASVSD